MILKDQIGGQTGPVALGSRLGYVLSGTIGRKTAPNVASTSCIAHCFVEDCSITDPKNENRTNLSKVFGNEELKIYGEEDIQVLEKFEEGFTLVDGRYQVRGPYKLPRTFLGDNYRNSYNRLISLLKQFEHKKDLLKKYDGIIREQMGMKVVEIGPRKDEGQLYYLPHRAVARDDKKTTSVRMVFDARMKSTKGGYSINDVLDKGPLLTPLLYLVLLRCRCKNVLINADLEKAFLQILFHEDDMDMLRFLWVENIYDIDFQNINNNTIIELRNCRVLFGLKPSPHLLCAVLRKHIRRYHSEEYKELIEKLINALHTDRVLRDSNKFFSPLDIKICTPV